MNPSVFNQSNLLTKCRASAGFHPIRANQSKKTFFSAFGTVILERLATAGPSFLASPRNEAKRQQQSTKAPTLWIIESAAGGIGSFLAPKRSPAPLVPRSGVFQGDFKKPYAKSVVVMLFTVC
jgi:hypothetical protein